MKWSRKLTLAPFMQKGEIPITSEATALELCEQMIVEATELFPIAWGNFLSSQNVRVQGISTAKVWPQRKPSDSLIRNSLEEKEVRNLVRAMCRPWPRSYIVCEGKRVEIDSVSHTFKPGAILYETSDGKSIYLLPVSTCADRHT